MIFSRVSELPGILYKDISKDDMMYIIDDSDGLKSKRASMTDLWRFFNESVPGTVVVTNEFQNIIKSKVFTQSIIFSNNVIDEEVIKDYLGIAFPNASIRVTETGLVIKGLDDLTAESDGHDAANKNYVDTAVSKVEVAIDNDTIKKTEDKKIYVNTDKIATKNYVDDTFVKKVSGKDLSTNDFTDDYKGKLDNLDTELGKKLDKNSEITAATNCKITYDKNGLVTSGTDLEKSDIPDIDINQVSELVNCLSTLWEDKLEPNNRAKNRTSISFKPKVFTDLSYTYIKSFSVLVTDDSSSLPLNPVYCKLLDPDDTSKALSLSDGVNFELNKYAKFTFTDIVRLESNKEYKIVFYTSQTGIVQNDVGLKLYVASTDQDIYFGTNKTWRPITKFECIKSIGNSINSIKVNHSDSNPDDIKKAEITLDHLISDENNEVYGYYDKPYPDKFTKKFSSDEIFSLVGSDKIYVAGGGLSASEYAIAYLMHEWYGSYGTPGTGLYWSEDGETWHQSDINKGVFYTLYYVDGLFFAGEYLDKGLYWSDDGKNWNQTNLTTDGFFTVLKVKDRYLAGSSEGIYWSYDGKWWNQTNLTSDWWYTLYYVEEHDIVLVGSNNGKGLWYSTDHGKTWTKWNITDFACIYSICYKDGTFVAGCGDHGEGSYYSYDGITWQKSNNETVNFYQIESKFGLFIGANASLTSSSGTTGLYWSDDGINWTQSNVTTGSFIKLYSYDNLLIACNGTFSGKSTGVWYSSDGKNWTQSDNINNEAVTYAYGDEDRLIICGLKGIYNANLLKINKRSLATEHDIEKLDNSTIVRTNTIQTITEDKYFTKSVILKKEAKPVAVPTVYPLSYELPSSMSNLPSTVEITGGNYKLNEDLRTTNIVVTSGIVHLYVPKGKSIKVNGNITIRVNIGATLYLYNEGYISCQTNDNNSAKSSIILNNGTCYIYGSGTFAEEGLKHWYGICNHGDYMEINGGVFRYDQPCTSTMCENAYATFSKTTEYDTYVPGVNSSNPRIVINAGIFNENYNATHGTMKNDVRGDAVINNCIFYNNGAGESDRVFKSCGYSMIVNGGQFYSTGRTGLWYGFDSDNYDPSIISTYRLEINGGVFHSTTSCISVYEVPSTVTNLTLLDPIVIGGRYKGSLAVNKGSSSVEYKKLEDLMPKEYMYDIDDDEYMVVDSVSNFVRDYHGFKSDVGAILRTRDGLVIAGVRNINSDNSVVTKDYVDSKFNEHISTNWIKLGGKYLYIKGNNIFISDTEPS